MDTPIVDIGSVIVTLILITIECKKIKKLIINDIVDVKIMDNNNLIITIERKYGSGGKYIGQELAKQLGIKCYDNELLKIVSQDYHIDIKTLESLDEKQKGKFWYGFATNYVLKKIKKIDKERADYYEKFTSEIWENKLNYDICIDTSKVGTDEAVSLLIGYIKNK